MDAIKHLFRISRVLRQPRGNVLLLGMGGSGRQSLTRFSAHIADCNCMSIELTKTYGLSDWKNDLKEVMQSDKFYISSMCYRCMTVTRKNIFPPSVVALN